MHPVFVDRADAGRRLAEALVGRHIARPVVVAIPRGGVPVGVEVARALRCPLRPIVLRKLFIPSSPEAGFGAMDPDGGVFIDEGFVRELALTPEEVEGVIREVRAELKRRQHVYETVRADDVRGRDAILVDDGIAAGYSMSSAAAYLRRFQPSSLRVAVPCSPVRSLERVKRLADEVICLNVSSASRFAVADFYSRWHDLSDREVAASLAMLEKFPSR